MKKRIFSLIMALLMLMAVVLTGCSNEKSDDEKRRENASKGDKALTLSIWIPTEADTNDPKFVERLTAVENGINDIIASTNTKIKLVAISDAEYEAKLNEKLTYSKNSGLTKPIIVSETYVNDAEPIYPDESNKEDYFYQIKYPALLDNQIDICLIRDYATYSNLANGGYLYALNAYVTSETASYPRVKKIIRDEVLKPLILKNNLYAIPNNRAYAPDCYQYIMIDKALATEAGVTVDPANITSILDCEEIITKIAALNVSGVVPYVGGPQYAPGVTYWAPEGSSSLITTATDSTKPITITDNEAYMSYMAFYKMLNDGKNAADHLVEGEKAGVFHYTGTLAGAQAYAENYYTIKVGNPVMTEKEVYGSMFAITDYSINYDRAMSVLFTLNTNEKIRTLLQYGIEDVDYILDYTEDEENPKIRQIRDENGHVVYDMNNDYMGNGYITYREDGTVLDDWDYVKQVNYDATVSKYLHLNTNYQAGTSSEDKATHAQMASDMNTFATEIFAEIDAMTYEEFLVFVEACKAAKGLNVADIEKKIADGEAEYLELKAKAEPTEDELKKIEDYEALLEQQATYKVSSTCYKLVTSELLNTALTTYTTIETTYNK